MAQQALNYGSAPEDGNGEGLFYLFQKTDNNFGELYDLVNELDSTAGADANDIRKFGVVGDGRAEDSEIIRQKFEEGGVYYFPSGDYDIQTVIDSNLSNDLTIVGDSASLVRFFGRGQKSVTTAHWIVHANLVVSGVHFDQCNGVFSLDGLEATDTVLDRIVILDCDFTNSGYPLNQMYSAYLAGFAGGVDRLVFKNNLISNCTRGLRLEGRRYRNTLIADNTIEDVTRWGIILGSAFYQDEGLTRHITVRDNTIQNVTYDGTSSSGGAWVRAQDARITGNTFFNIHSSTDATNTALKLTAQWSTVDFNRFINAGSGLSAIYTEGANRAQSGIKHGYANRIASNNIRYTSDWAQTARGIICRTVDTTITGNHIEGTTGIPITVDGDWCNNLSIAENLLKKTKGTHGIYVLSNGTNLLVERNRIESVERDGGTFRGVELRPAASGATIGDVTVRNNRFVKASGTADRTAVYIMATAGATVSVVDVVDNHIDDTFAKGVSLTGGGTIEHIGIGGNRIHIMTPVDRIVNTTAITPLTWLNRYPNSVNSTGTVDGDNFSYEFSSEFE